MGLDGLRSLAGDRGHTRQGEALAEDGRVRDDRPVGRIELVEARRDEGRQRLRNGQVGQVAGRSVDPALRDEPALRQEHPNDLDGIQRDPVRARHDRVACRGRQARDEAGQQLAHRLDGQRLQVDRRERPLAGAPVGPPIEELRSGERDDQDRRRSGSTRAGGR